MTKAEVQDIITEELKRALGRHAGQFDIRETTAQREEREKRLKESERQAKWQRKQAKRDRREAMAVAESLGITDKAGQKAFAQGRPTFNG